jgi:hypothetical protein
MPFYGLEQTQMELAKEVEQSAAPLTVHDPGSPLSASMQVPP